MSYDIYIGEAHLDGYEEEGEFWATWEVEHHIHVDAPTFPGDHLTGNSNGRHPGYSQWADFCRMAGIYNLFYNEEDGFLRRHPGCFSLRPHHLAAIKDARKAWEEKNPGAVPGWDFDPQWHGAAEVDDDVRGRDGVLARLLWLEWWMCWALENCERPAISNR